jgi:hypothetical protein
MGMFRQQWDRRSFRLPTTERAMGRNLHRKRGRAFQNDSLKRGELVQPGPLHNLRVLGAETRIVFSRSPYGATAIHKRMLGNQNPSLHLFTPLQRVCCRSESEGRLRIQS